MHPVDVNTGQQSGSEIQTADELVLKGYLVTHKDGFEAIFKVDRTHVEIYAVRNHAKVEPMFVLRAKK